MNLFTETCTLRNQGAELPGEFDDYGNAKRAPATDAEEPCWYEPRGSSEDTSAKDQQVDGYWLYLRLEAPITADTTVALAGAEYQVVGEPGRQPGGFIVPGFTKAALERTRG